jgi:hypothetical protein
MKKSSTELGVRRLRVLSVENAAYTRSNMTCQNAIALGSEVHAIGEVILAVVFHYGE